MGRKTKRNIKKRGGINYGNRKDLREKHAGRQQQNESRNERL